MSAAADNGLGSKGNGVRTHEDAPRHGDPPPSGDRDRNPHDVGLLGLLAEDYRTHDGHFFEPGFMALAVHRVANARWRIKSRAARLPVTVGCRAAYTWVKWVLGIDLPYSTQVGRRVRIWHHGGMTLGARAIGDDVHIRQNTTFGVLKRDDAAGVPIIGNGVELGPGVCIVGPVTVGDGSTVGPNSLVMRDVPPGAVFVGVPARQSTLRVEPSPGAAPPGERDPSRGN